MLPLHNSHASAHLQAASVGMGPTSSRTPSPHQKNTRLPKSRPLDAITTKCPFAHQCASFRVTALPTPAPIPTGSTHVVAATVSLAGITAGQFDATAKSAFKEVVATYLSLYLWDRRRLPGGVPAVHCCRCYHSLSSTPGRQCEILRQDN